MQHLVNFVHGADVVFGVLFGNVTCVSFFASDRAIAKTEGNSP
jgi:hypothetical protein